jgi:hypothetical protein
MKYYAPEDREKAEIIKIVNECQDDDRVVEALLSALYYHETQFAGDVLLWTLQRSSGKRRLYLFRLANTLLHMHFTDYLSSSFLREMENVDGIPEADYPEVDELKDSVRETVGMVQGRALEEGGGEDD